MSEDRTYPEPTHPWPEHESASIDQLAAAMAKAQGAMKPASKGSKNPHFKSKYASLADVVAALREPFSENGLSYIQRGVMVDGRLICRTRLLHESGQWIESDFPCMTGENRNPMQAAGSAWTYARRYGLMAIVGVAPADEDDGNAAASQAWPSQAEADTWRGPLGKHALKEKCREFSQGLKASTDTDMLAALEHDFRPVLQQCRDNPIMADWLKSALSELGAKQQQLQAAEASGEQTLLDAG